MNIHNLHVFAVLSAKVPVGPSVRFSLSVFSLSLLLISSGYAQTTSTIIGTVQDKQGLTVPGAKAAVQSVQLAIDRTIVTENDGTYRIAALPPGLYEITVSKDGDPQFDGSTKK